MLYYRKGFFNMTEKTEKYIFVADSHIHGGKEEDNFFRMLKQLETLPPSVAVVFLGDIFELWIAMRNYENESHARFCGWCRQQKQVR